MAGTRLGMGGGDAGEGRARSMKGGRSWSRSRAGRPRGGSCWREANPRAEVWRSRRGEAGTRSRPPELRHSRWEMMRRPTRGPSPQRAVRVKARRDWASAAGATREGIHAGWAVMRRPTRAPSPRRAVGVRAGRDEPSTAGSDQGDEPAPNAGGRGGSAPCSLPRWRRGAVMVDFAGGLETRG